jgi:hypothetical protein
MKSLEIKKFQIPKKDWFQKDVNQEWKWKAKRKWKFFPKIVEKENQIKKLKKQIEIIEFCFQIMFIIVKKLSFF